MSNNTPDYNDNLYFGCTVGDNDLTAQWRKGELPSGWYYLKVNEELANCPVISECVDDYNLGLPISYFYDFDVAKIEQVLAPVPSYQWVIDHSFKRFSQRLFEKTLEDNKKLKELLRTCAYMIDWKKVLDDGYKGTQKLFDDIGEALK